MMIFHPLLAHFFGSQRANANPTKFHHSLTISIAISLTPSSSIPVYLDGSCQIFPAETAAEMAHSIVRII